MRVPWIAAVMAASCWGWSPAIAQSVDAELGVLTCTLAEPAEVAAGAAGASAGQMRDALCSFKPRTGAEETYAGRVQGVSLSPDPKASVMWLVKGAPGTPLQAGLLQQAYAADPKTSSDQIGPMIGEMNSNIILHSMADKQEGSARAAEKPRPTGFVITGIELKLKSTSG